MPHSPTKDRIFAAGHFSLVLRAGCCTLLVAGAAAAAGQRTAPPQEPAPAVRLVSAEQGRKIAAAALDRDEPLRGAQDCSHLVQQIYSVAGYEYPYASSFDLYAGNGNFRRVKHAQAGDLVTWPGHVGIVVDARHHSFYSLVRSGLQSQDYLSPYWRSRGRPRFYRYVVAANSEVETAKVAQPAPHSAENSSRRSSAVPTDVRAEARDANAREADPKPTAEEASMRSTMPPARESSSARAPSSAKEPSSLAVSEPVLTRILVTSEQRRPTNSEAYDKILELSSPAVSTLRGAEAFHAKTPIVILDELQVERVETKRDKGSVHLQIDSHVRIADDGVEFKHRREKARWELRRDQSGWMVIAPADRSYVTRDVAVRELAANLAEMTQSEAAANHDESVIAQEARIANLLSALLQN
jgi:hypothetical protein